MAVVVTPDYPSIQCIRDLVKPWIELLGGDEWGDSMRSLHSACHTDYGFSDEDCALFASKLFENLEHMKTSGWIDEDGPSYCLFGSAEVAKTQERCREVREYWRKGGNLGDFGPTIGVATKTLDTIPGWIFGEGGDASIGE